MESVPTATRVCAGPESSWRRSNGPACGFTLMEASSFYRCDDRPPTGRQRRSTQGVGAWGSGAPTTVRIVACAGEKGEPPGLVWH